MNLSGRGPITRTVNALTQDGQTNRARGGQNVLTARTTRGTFQRPLRSARPAGQTQQNQTLRWL